MAKTYSAVTLAIQAQLAVPAAPPDLPPPYLAVPGPGTLPPPCLDDEELRLGMARSHAC